MGSFVRAAARLTPYMSTTQPYWELSVNSGGKNTRCLVIYIHYQLAVVPTER